MEGRIPARHIFEVQASAQPVAVVEREVVANNSPPIRGTQVSARMGDENRICWRPTGRSRNIVGQARWAGGCK